MIADISIVVLALIYTALSLIALRFARFTRDYRMWRAVAITSIFQNGVFLGLPLTTVFFGDISAAAIYGLLMLALYIVVGYMLALARGGALRKVLKLPALYGFLAGIVLHYTARSPYSLLEPYTWIIHRAMSYGAVYILGISLNPSLKLLVEHVRELVVVAVWRFVVNPVIHYVVLLFTPLPSSYWKQLMFVSFMPPAVMNTVIARVYGWYPDVVAGITFALTLLSLVVSPAIALLLQ